MTLDELRQEIDETDNRLLELLAERGHRVRVAWALKAASGEKRLDVGREAEIILRLRARRSTRPGPGGRGAHLARDPAGAGTLVRHASAELC